MSTPPRRVGKKLGFGLSLERGGKGGGEEAETISMKCMTILIYKSMK